MHSTFVNNDINGISRPVSTSQGVPDIGAYEFIPNSLPPQAAAIPSFPSPGIQSFLFGQDTIAKITWPSSTILPSNVNVRLFSGTNPPNNFAGDHMKTYWEFTFPAGSYNYSLSLFYKDSWIGTNPNESSLKMARFNSGWTPFLGSLSAVDTAKNILSSINLLPAAIFTGTSVSNPLPVNLIHFSGKKQNQDISLSWATAIEINCSHFEIQKSFNGIDFETIDTINASGNSYSIRQYNSFDFNAIDNENIEIIYYRLKIVDYDGKTEFSQILTIDNSKFSELIPFIYPNPSKSEKVYLKIPFKTTNYINILVTDILGETVSEITLPSADNEIYELTELNKLKPGLYFINFSILDKLNIIKFIKY